jgi:RNA polymerase sigma-70 factor (ECF subfamily)
MNGPGGDRELVGRFLTTRDEDAFSALYEAHTPYLWRLAVRLCPGSPAEAEEIVQETWVRSVRLLPRFAWGSALRTWLAGILINCRREGYRTALRQAAVETEESKQEPATAEEGVDLERALASLSEELRTVLLLFDLEGYSHEEIATMLQIPAGTSKSRLFTARRTLRERLRHGGSR